MITVIRAIPRSWVRFIIGGGVNTGITYAIYYLLHLVMHYQAAYAIAFTVGVLFSYLFNAILVFGVAPSWRGLIAYPLVYLVQYLVSILALGVMVEALGVPVAVAPLIVVVLMIPLTYLLSRTVLKRSQSPGA